MKIKVYVVDVKLPRWARRALVFGAIPALILGLGALVHAMSVDPFTAGEVLTAESLNSRFSKIAANVPVVSEWKPYTATLVSSATTGTVTATTNARYRRVGDTVEVNISSDITQCTATGGQLRWSLPTSTTPDMSKLPYEFALIGHGTLLPATGLQVYAQGASSTFVAVDYLGSSGGGMGCTGPSGTAKGVRLAFSFPVSGWSVTGD